MTQVIEVALELTYCSLFVLCVHLWGDIALSQFPWLRRPMLLLGVALLATAAAVTLRRGLTRRSRDV